MKKILLFVLGCLLITAGQAMAEPENPSWGLRLSGGYGFSQNSSINFNTVGSPDAYELSPGIPCGAEVLYSSSDSMTFGLGIFPIFMSRELTAANLAHTGDVQQTDTATFLPVLANAYFGQDLGHSMNLFAGIGAGVVPATSVAVTSSGGPYGTTHLDAGLALRGLLGLDWAWNPHVHLGFLVQELAFNQAVMSPFVGWLNKSNSFNQIAPMLYAEFRI